MLCLSCGARLSDEAAKCPMCGKLTPRGELLSPYEIDDESIPFIDKPHQSSTSSTAALTSSQGISTKQNATYAARQSTLQYQLPQQQSSAVAAHSPDTGEQQVHPHRSMTASAAALSVILIFLLVVSGGFGYYLLKVQPSEYNAQATSVVQAILTAQAQASVQAFNAFTAQTPQAIYQQITSRHPDFSDSLNKQDNTLINFSQKYQGCFFSGDGYHAKMTATAGAEYSFCLAPNLRYSNFALQAKMTFVSGDDGGLLFRVNYKNFTFYRLNINRAGYYELYSRINNAPETILTSGYSLLINAAMNQSAIPSVTTTVVAYYSHIYLYVNGQLLAKVNDLGISSGVIGLTANANQNTTEVVFTDARLWIL